MKTSESSVGITDRISLSGLIKFVPVLFILGLVAIVLTSISASTRQSGRLDQVGVASRQQVLGERYVAGVLRGAVGQDTDWPATRELLEVSSKALVEGGAAPSTGATRVTLPASTGNTKAVLARQRGASKNLFEAGDAALGLKPQSPEWAKAIDRLIRAGEEFQVVAGEAVDRLTAQGHDEVGRAQKLQFALAALSIVLGTLVAILVLRRIRRIVGDVASGMEQMASGELGVRLPVRSHDEVGRLAVAFNTVCAKIGEAMREIAESSAALAGASEELTSVNSEMGRNSETTLSRAREAMSASDRVSGNFQSASAAAEEMTASIQEIARNAGDAAKVSREAVDAAKRANETVGALGESSAEIGNVIKVITSIAEQTNLLALNATIEAAGAGDAGKGFAVVANEVKELANETARATDDISRRIEQIQNDTRGAVLAIQEIGKVIEQISEYSNTIASAVEEQSATTGEIGGNVSEAHRGTEEIRANIGGVSEAAQSATRGVENSTHAAAELAKMATALQSLVGRFRT